MTEKWNSPKKWNEVFSMHIPIANKGHENLFVALANHKRVDGSTLCSSAGWIRCAPKMEYLICILAQHSPKKWNEVFSCSTHAGHNGSCWIFITVKCLLSVVWPVSRPTRIVSRCQRPLIVSIGGLIDVVSIACLCVAWPAYRLTPTLSIKIWHRILGLYVSVYDKYRHDTVRFG